MQTEIDLFSDAYAIVDNKQFPGRKFKALKMTSPTKKKTETRNLPKI